MRVLIVCGGRDYEPTIGDAWWLRGIVDALQVGTIRHGDARGVDRWAGRMALKWGLLVDACPARPDELDDRGRKLGSRAFPMRNREMLVRSPRPLAVAALVGGTGTVDMITGARAGGVLAIESPRRRSP